MDSLFKLVFQDGEFISRNSTILGISMDTIFTVFTTLIIFFLGFFLNRINENRKNAHALKELKEYYLQLIELLKNPVNNQISSLVKFSKELREKVEQHYFVSDITNFRVDLIIAVDTKNLYEILVKRNKGEIKYKSKLFGKLLAGIYYIDEVKKSMKATFRDFITKYEVYDKNFKDNLKITSEAYDEWRTCNEQNNLHPAQDNFLLKLDRIRYIWINHNGGNPNDGQAFQDRYIVKDYYLEPMLELCRNTSSDRRAIFLISHILECIYAFDNIEELKYVYRRHYLLDARGIQKAYIEINDAISKLLVTS